MTSAETQAAAVAAASRYWRGTQSGPKPKAREALYLADLLEEAAGTLALLARYSHRFDPVISDVRRDELDRLVE